VQSLLGLKDEGESSKNWENESTFELAPKIRGGFGGFPKASSLLKETVLMDDGTEDTRIIVSATEKWNRKGKGKKNAEEKVTEDENGDSKTKKTKKRKSDEATITNVAADESLEVIDAPKTKTKKTSKKKESAVTTLEDQDLHLDAALTRRTDWTPIKNSPIDIIDESDIPSKAPSFAQLSESFGYRGESLKAIGTRESNEDYCLTRRRSVEVSI
jgi:hypothetical protein